MNLLNAAILLAAAGAIFICAPAFASISWANNPTQIHAMNNGKILFSHAGPRTSPLPACASIQPYRWAFDANTAAGQAKLSLLMTAYAMGKKIVVVGTNTCPDYPDSESVDYLYIAD